MENVAVGLQTRYALSGDVHIAYQVTGEAPFDLVFVPGFVTHMEMQWKLPGFGDFLRALGSFVRLIRGDKRGTGMSEVAGIAVHTGARVAAQAGADEILVSSTVKDLVAGSGHAFVERGLHDLKGIPGEWRLFAVRT